MNNYIPKPFKPWQLIAAIAELTGREKKYQAKSEPSLTTHDIPLTTSPVTDLAYLNKFCEGDGVKMRKYIDLFQKRVPLFFEKMKEAIQLKDREVIRAQVHSIKSTFLMMGMTKTRDLAQQIELQCKDDTGFANIHKNLKELLEQLNISLKELNNVKYS